MDKNKLRILSSFAALAILSLISVQLYWITSVYELRKENFEKLARESLVLTASEVEKREVCLETFSKSYLKPGERLLIIRENSENAADTLGLFTVYKYNEDSVLSDLSRFKFRYPALAEVSLRYKMQLGDTAFAENNYSNIPDFQDINLENYRRMIRDERPVSEFIRLSDVDSILALNLSRKGINDPFQYGIKKMGAPDYEYLSSPEIEENLEASILKTSFLEGKYFNNPHEMILYFPDQGKALLGSMWMLLAISAFLTLLLFLAFWKMTKTIHRQGELARMKNDFINNMTHELNTPLTSISLAGQSLKDPRTKKDENSLKRLSQVIDLESTRLFNHLDRILQMGVIENGKFLLKDQQVNIHRHIWRLKELFDHKIGRGEIHLDLKAERPVVRGDEHHIGNILYNLMDNAIKYSNGYKFVRITTISDDFFIHIKVYDKGIGIRKEDQEKIFEKFTRISNIDRHDIKGFGIGLSYVRKIVESHGGKISLKSSPGKGTCFTLSFPLEKEHVYEENIFA